MARALGLGYRAVQGLVPHGAFEARLRLDARAVAEALDQELRLQERAGALAVGGTGSGPGECAAEYPGLSREGVHSLGAGVGGHSSVM
jgi:hypothetical protein